VSSDFASTWEKKVEGKDFNPAITEDVVGYVKQFVALFHLIKIVFLILYLKYPKVTYFFCPLIYLNAILHQFLLVDKGEIGLLTDFYHSIGVFICLYVDLHTQPIYMVIYLSTIYFITDPYIY
jgi:hypothetical protein